MTLNSFFKEIQFHKAFLLDMRDYEIDFIMNAAESYGIDKTALMYHIIEYREKHKHRVTHRRKFFYDVETGDVFTNKKDFFKKNKLSVASGYKHGNARLKEVTINDLDKLGVDYLEL